MIALENFSFHPFIEKYVKYVWSAHKLLFIYAITNSEMVEMVLESHDIAMGIVNAWQKCLNDNFIEWH